MEVSEVTRDHLERAIFGKQVEEFWDSEIGQYLLARALQEYNTALEELKVCHNIADMFTLQGKVWRAESFQNWLSAAITDGLKAKNILEHGDDED